MKLNTYETTIVIHPRRSKTDVSATIKKYKALLKEEQAKVLHEDNEGLKNLAYPIEKQTSATYYTLQCQAPPTTIEKLERAYHIDEDIIRFLSVKLDKHGVTYHEKKRKRPKGEKAASEEGQDVATEEDKEKIKSASNLAQEGRRYCRFRKFRIKYIDYKEKNFLLRFLNPQGKILPRRLTGTSAKYQKRVDQAVKRARILAMLPFLTDNLK